MTRFYLSLIILIIGAILFFTGAVYLYLTFMLIGSFLVWVN